MTKTKIAVGAMGVAVGAAIMFASIVGAQTAPSVTCVGNVATNTVTWTASTTGGVAPFTFAWTGAVTGTTNPITATYNATGTVTAGVRVTDASSTVATTTCSATILTLPVTNPTTTPPVVTPPPPHLNRPQLQIDANGKFLARGMTVTSVSSGTIVATVWGNTYTINLGAGGSFLRRDGNELPFTLSQQVNVGDEISAMGIIDPSAPFVVNAGVVRDQSIVTPRQNHDDNEDNNGGEDHGGNHGDNHGGRGNGLGNIFFGGNGTSTGSSTIDAQERLKDLLKQLQNLQSIFNSQRGNGGGNGGGEGHGGRD